MLRLHVYGRISKMEVSCLVEVVMFGYDFVDTKGRYHTKINFHMQSIPRGRILGNTRKMLLWMYIIYIFLFRAPIANALSRKLLQYPSNSPVFGCTLDALPTLPLPAGEITPASLRIHENDLLSKIGDDPHYKCKTLLYREQRISLYPPSKWRLDPFESYIHYRLGWDYGGGVGHHNSILSGMIYEADNLTRVLVLSPVLVDAKHNNGLNQVKDVAVFYNLQWAKEKYPFLDYMSEAEFFGRFKASLGVNQSISWRTVGRISEIYTEQLKNLTDMVLERDYTKTGDLLLYDVEKMVPRPPQVPFAPHLVQLVDAIAGEMGEFSYVHVRRGLRLQDPKYPNLDRDTQPSALLEKLPKFVPVGHRIFIATDETAPGFFNPLNNVYQVKMFEDFAHLIAPGSAWHTAVSAIEYPGSNIDFDNYQKEIVEYLLRLKAKVEVETLRDLASDKEN